MFGVSDVAEGVATRKDRFIQRYVLNSSVVCQMCTLVVNFFSTLFFYFLTYFPGPISTTVSRVQ